MKLNKFFIAGGILAASMGITSCVGDLDLQPTNPNEITSGMFGEDPEQYMREVMADVYLNISSFGPNGSNILGSMDGGMSTFQRAVFNMEEVPSDETNWQPTADAVPHSLNFGEVAANETFVLGSYQRMMVASSLCNQFMQTDFQLKTDEQRALKAEFDRQCKILRSGMYFYLVSLFGNVPYNDENVLIGEVAPQLSADFNTGRRMVTENVVNTLEDIVAWYKANEPNNNPPYGYVGLDVAEALLVKFYLNYEVFTGTPAWQQCLNHAEALIARRQGSGFLSADGTSTGLAMNYFQNFSYNNRTDALSEIIWRIPQVTAQINSDTDYNTGLVNGTPNVGVQSWANGGFMVNGFIGDTTADSPFQCHQADYNSGNGWKCMSARRQLTDVFDWNADYTASPDDRVTWWKTAKDGFGIDNDDLAQPAWGTNGFLPTKFTNWYINDNGEVEASYTTFFDDKGNPKDVNIPVNVIDLPNSPVNGDPLGIDYGMIRLAEIYLSAAEAILNGASSTIGGSAAKYASYTHERAGLGAYTSIDRYELRNERQRELYTECTRRTDLVRYGLWISGYNWNWKAHVREGADFPASFIVYPIPATVVTTNGYVQNPGY